MIMKIELSPEALAALNAESDEPVKPLLRDPGWTEKDTARVDGEIAMVTYKQIARAVHGPSIRPTFRQRLLHYSSFAAISAVWAAAHFKRMQRERTRH